MPNYKLKISGAPLGRPPPGSLSLHGVLLGTPVGREFPIHFMLHNSPAEAFSAKIIEVIRSAQRRRPLNCRRSLRSVEPNAPIAPSGARTGGPQRRKPAPPKTSWGNNRDGSRQGTAISLHTFRYQRYFCFWGIGRFWQAFLRGLPAFQKDPPVLRGRERAGESDCLYNMVIY